MPYKNKLDQKKSSKKHYEENKDLIKDRAIAFKKIARERNRKFIDNYLSKNFCIDCGEKDIVVLEFDHIGTDKEMDISTAINRGWSIKKLEKEIKKCEVRCANCHRRMTHKRRNIMRSV